MAVKINAGRAKSTPARSTRKSTAKPAAKTTGAKRGTTGTRGASTRKRSEPKAQAPAASSRRSPVAQTDDRTMKRLLSEVEKAGKLRKKAEEAHKATVQALHEAAQAALEGGVPMARVSDVSGISRQWLYKMGEFAGRGGSNGDSKSGAKATTRPTTRGTRGKASTAKATPAKSTKRTQSKTQSKSARPRIRAAK